ncbi:cyclic nucleotide-binding/CBS domain-containing protein [Azospirillum griseum]|uniref:CBS domain-containing protein n=1 Tax=Azospirillum griseum TaxID=2496639 RepID=A0A3S0I092_9PROT|nr:CBS domain-containing protein [Azospirillum griseum]RTR23735.1 CBS domain-containing protein [Azospirillum griseum]
MPSRAIRAIVRNQRVYSVPTSATVRTAAHMMKEYRVGALMVVDGDQLIGIFTERDALFRVLAGNLDPDRTSVGDVMTANPTTIAPDRPMGHALHLMHEGGFRHLPVAENGVPLGMVSIRDALGMELIDFEQEVDDRDAIAEILG